MAGKTIAPRKNDVRLDDWSPQLLKSRLYGQLLVDIIIGALAPGERLDEQALAKRYGGGLAGIREALARLALEGLVLRRARVGTMVAPLDLMEAREAFVLHQLDDLLCRVAALIDLFEQNAIDLAALCGVGLNELNRKIGVARSAVAGLAYERNTICEARVALLFGA